MSAGLSEKDVKSYHAPNIMSSTRSSNAGVHSAMMKSGLDIAMSLLHWRKQNTVSEPTTTSSHLAPIQADEASDATEQAPVGGRRKEAAILQVAVATRGVGLRIEVLDARHHDVLGPCCVWGGGWQAFQTCAVGSANAPGPLLETGNTKTQDVSPSARNLGHERPADLRHNARLRLAVLHSGRRCVLRLGRQALQPSQHVRRHAGEHVAERTLGRARTFMSQQGTSAMAQEIC